MTLKTQKRPLFVYDWYGTVEAPWWSVFLIEQHQERCIAQADGRKYYPTKTLAEFKKQHNNQNTILIPGMEETIRFTASIGNNILISDGNHLKDACSDLLALADCFKSWMFDGKLIEFGYRPETKSKTDPKIAEALIKQFEPDKIFVIGDSNTEAQFAEILHADTFIFCGLDKTKITDGKTLPHIEHHITGYPMITYIKERFKKKLFHNNRKDLLSQYMLKFMYASESK